MPRDAFPPEALREISSARTLFQVTHHVDDFLPAFGVGVPQPATGDATAATDDDEAEFPEDEPNAEVVDTYSRDFIVSVLKTMDPSDFEHFVAALLNAMGYRASATQASGDGGVDVIASRDPLGIEPPIIKVQCKRTTNTMGGPAVQQLAGTLAHGGGELGLFVTLGTYSVDARNLERTRQDLRLVNGSQLVDFVLEYYEALDPEWKRLLPLKRVYAVDRGGDG